jgi:hypothetical protein
MLVASPLSDVGSFGCRVLFGDFSGVSGTRTAYSDTVALYRYRGKFCSAAYGAAQEDFAAYQTLGVDRWATGCCWCHA